MDSSLLKAIAFIILLVGGINSGLLGLFDFNILHLFGTFLYRIILIVVGASAGYLGYMRFVKKSF